LSYLSENFNEDGETKYWRNEQIDLTEYAGKKVQFRWINHSYSSRHNAASLDNIVINGFLSDYAEFNKDGWDAGIVNHDKAINSGDQFTIINRGKNSQQIKAITFTTDNFQSSLTAGQRIEPSEGIKFNVQFNVNKTVGMVEDIMTVEFESGLTASFPVKGEGLAEDVLYYSFEINPLDYSWKSDFTQIDVDQQVTYKSNYYLTVLENDGGRFAFTQAIHHNPNLTAHSGEGTIAAVAPDNNSAADDWLISKQLRPADGATFDFYGRNLSTTGSVFVGDNDLHCVEVLVSETGNTKTADFKTVMNSTEMSYLGENQWHHFTVDLSAYAGKDIYVALRHTTVSANWIAFFDDFTFTHVTASGESGINSQRISEDALITVFTADGVQVAQGHASQTLQGLRKGLYLIKTADGQTVKTVRK